MELESFVNGLKIFSEHPHGFHERKQLKHRWWANEDEAGDHFLIFPRLT